jgi:hypothetical protein
MTKQSLDAFRRTVTVAWPALQDKQAKEHLLVTAKAGNAATIKEQQQRSGIAPTVEGYANKPGNPVDNVMLPGPIVYQYQYMLEVLTVALFTLRQNSPVVSGAYRNNHTLYVDGTSVKGVPSQIPDGAELYISNPLPYVRKLEIGKTRSGRDFVVQVPDQIYERTTVQLARRFGNVASIYFGFVVITQGAVADWSASRSGRRAGLQRGGSLRARTEWKQRQPAILIGKI